MINSPCCYHIDQSGEMVTKFHEIQRVTAQTQLPSPGDPWWNLSSWFTWLLENGLLASLSKCTLLP